MRRFCSFIFCFMATLSAGGQTNTIGTPITSDMFGFTVFNHGLSPVLPHSIVRSWDSQHVSWVFLNPTRGTYNWKTLDAFTSAHAGKEMIYTFGVMPGWAASIPSYGTPYRYGSSCSMPANVADWDTFVTAVATHAPQIKYWELWNEPMNYQYWCHGPNIDADFATFATMAQHANRIIKKIIPGAVILAPSTDKPFGQAWFKKFLAAGGAKTFDVMTIHGYPDGGPEGMVPMIDQYKSLMAANGINGMPIWDTEVAWGPDPSLLAKFYILSWSSGVARTIWYAYDNNGLPLWNPTTGITVTGVGYQQVYDWLVGATMTSPCAKDGAGTYSCPLSRNHYKGEILWNSTSTINMAAPNGFKQYRDLQGATHPVTGGHIAVGNSPILVETSSYPKSK